MRTNNIYLFYMTMINNWWRHEGLQSYCKTKLIKFWHQVLTVLDLFSFTVFSLYPMYVISCLNDSFVKAALTGTRSFHLARILFPFRGIHFAFLVFISLFKFVNPDLQLNSFWVTMEWFHSVRYPFQRYEVSQTLASIVF